MKIKLKCDKCKKTIYISRPNIREARKTKEKCRKGKFICNECTGGNGSTAGILFEIKKVG